MINLPRMSQEEHRRRAPWNRQRTNEEIEAAVAKANKYFSDHFFCIILALWAFLWVAIDQGIWVALACCLVIALLIGRMRKPIQ